MDVGRRGLALVIVAKSFKLWDHLDTDTDITGWRLIQDQLDTDHILTQDQQQDTDLDQQDTDLGLVRY